MKTKLSKNATRYVVLFAIIIALTFAALPIPFLFLIPLLFVAVTFGFYTTLLTSFFFGLISLVLSFVGGGGFVPLAFIEQPIIPIVPRILVGVFTFLVNFGLSKAIKKDGKLRVLLPKAVAAAVGSITNTVFVILFMYILLPPSFSGGEYNLAAYTPIMIVSGLIELAINVLVLPSLAAAVHKSLRLTGYRDMMMGWGLSEKRIRTNVENNLTVEGQ